MEDKPTVCRESVAGNGPSEFRSVRVALVRLGANRVVLSRVHGDNGTQVRGAGRLYHFDTRAADQQPLDRTTVHVLVFARRAHTFQRPEDVLRSSEIHYDWFCSGVFRTFFVRARPNRLHGQVFPVQKLRIQTVHWSDVGQRVANAGQRRRERRGSETILAGRGRNRRTALAATQTVARRKYI